MDKVDFDHELGEAAGGNRIYPSKEDLVRCQPCTAECGVVKVEVRLLKVIQEENFQPDKVVKPKEITPESLRQRRLERAARNLSNFSEAELAQIMQLIKDNQSHNI